MTRLEIAFALLAGLWAGQIIGVSFIATPAKFLAPSISLPVALDVGRATFHVSVWVELALGLVLLTTGVAAFGFGYRTLMAVGVLLLLVVQSTFLLPILDQRVELILTGRSIESSWHHFAWIAGDAMRLLLLFGLCMTTLRQTPS